METEKLRDFNVASAVAFNINRLDRLVFGNQHALPIVQKDEAPRCTNYKYQFGLGGNKAMNLPISYIVYQPGAHEYLMSANRYDFLFEPADMLVPKPCPSRVVLGAISAHEVRHRIQRTPPSNINFGRGFTPENTAGNPYLSYLRTFAERSLRILELWGSDPSQDFDAMIIEGLVLHSLRVGLNSQNYIRSLMLMTPAELPKFLKQTTRAT